MATTPVQIAISVQAIVTRVRSIVQDPYYTDAIVLGYFNELLLDIAGGLEVVEPDGSLYTMPPLPDLFTIGSFTAKTAQAYNAMPSTFQRDLIKVVNAAGTSIPIEEDIDALTRGNPLLAEAGAVRHCALKGRNLYYQGIPTADEALTAHFFRAPYVMSLTDTTIDGIPDFLARPLFLNGGCARIYDEIEDGTEGNKTSTNLYTGHFNQALLRLAKWIGVNGESLYLNKTPMDTGAVYHN